MNVDPDEQPQQPELPYSKVETIINDEDDRTLAFLHDVALWPPIGAVVELGNPNRDAVVREVTLRLFPGHASIAVRVHDLGRVVPKPDKEQNR